MELLQTTLGFRPFVLVQLIPAVDLADDTMTLSVEFGGGVTKEEVPDFLRDVAEEMESQDADDEVS